MKISNQEKREIRNAIISQKGDGTVLTIVFNGPVIAYRSWCLLADFLGKEERSRWEYRSVHGISDHYVVDWEFSSIAERKAKQNELNSSFLREIDETVD